MDHEELMEWMAEQLSRHGSPTAIAKKIDVHHGVIATLIADRGKANLFWGTFVRIADYLGVKIWITKDLIRLDEWDRIVEAIHEHAEDRTNRKYVNLMALRAKMARGEVSSDWRQTRVRTLTMVGCIENTGSKVVLHIGKGASNE